MERKYEQQLVNPDLLGEKILTSGPERIFQGEIETIKNIPSLTKDVNGNLVPAEFNRFTRHIEYPSVLVEALETILNNYNNAFNEVLIKRQPGNENYQFARFDGQNFINVMVQVDMRGLPLWFLKDAHNYPKEILAEVIKNFLFEAENSLAMYGFMRGFGSPENGSDPSQPYSSRSFFGVNFDSYLKTLEERFQRGIFLGTTTNDKFIAMLTSEFGLSPEEMELLTPKRVKALSGFSGFLNPQKVEEFYKGNKNVILYMRTSHPKKWLAHPGKETPYTIPLLEDDQKRRWIRKRSITPNVDDPRMVNFLISGLQSGQFRLEQDEGKDIFMVPNFEGNEGIIPQIINDTKEYFVFMGLPVITDPNDSRIRELYEKEFNFRIKPLWLHYGCYGHLRSLDIGSSFKKFNDFVGELRRNIKMRGPYILQPEIPAYQVSDPENGDYEVIHRLFLGYDPESRRYKFIGGLYDALPHQSEEAKKGRLHGNNQAVWGQIIVKNEEKIIDPNSLNYINTQPMEVLK
jgi:hypothetical protein